jgi:hypothetical protein
LPVRVALLFLLIDTITVKVPKADVLVHTSRNKARVIFKPTDRSDEPRMLLKLPILWSVPSVEFVY